MIHLPHKFLLLCLAFFISMELRVDAYCPPSLEVKTGYFFFADKKMRSIYNDGGFDIQLSGSLPISDCFQFYTSLEYLRKEGHSVGGNQKTSIWQVPLTFGLKACAQLSETTSYYLTLGPRYFHIHMHNDSQYVDRNLTSNGIGAFVGTGFTYAPYDDLFFDLFGEYSYENTRFHPKTNVYNRNIQVGGFVFGGGLGCSF